MTPPPPVTNAYLLERIRALDTRFETLDRAIRGSNGELGIVARLTLIERSLAPLAKLDEFYTTVKAEIAALETNLTALTQSVTAHHAEAREEEIREKTKPIVPQKQDTKEFGTWSWFRDTYLDKVVLTIVTVVLTTIVIYVLQGAFGIP